MTKHKQKSKSKQQKRRGFAQRTVVPAGAEGIENPPRKNASYSWLNALGGVAKHLGGKVMDGLAIVQPELAPLRGLIKQKYGFAERDVNELAGGQSGGAVVSVEDAPVAFARNPIRTGMRMLGKTARGGQVVWVRDQVSGSLTTAATGSTFSLGSKYLIPAESTVFPNFYQEFLYWERWRPLKCILHYCHFAPTSTQAAVMLGYSSAPQVTLSSVVTTTSKFMGYEHVVQGSAYEDFAVVIEDEMWKQGLWLGNYASASVAAADNSTGQIMWATDANVPTNTAIGYLYVELIFELCDKRPLYSGAGLIMEAHVASRYAKTDEEWDALFNLLSRKLTRLWKEEHEARRQQGYSVINLLDEARLELAGQAVTPKPLLTQTANALPSPSLRR